MATADAAIQNARMGSSATSTARRLCLLLALLVPFVVDPFGDDTLALKRLALAAAGLGALMAEGSQLLGRRERPRPLRLPEGLLLALALWAAVGLSWAPNRELALLEVFALLGLVGLLRTRRAAVPEDGDVRPALVGVLVVGLGAIAIDALLVRQGSAELDAARAKFASALFTHNNIAAAYAVLLAPIGLALAVAAQGLAARLLGWVSVVVVPLYVGVQLKSRAGLAALLVGLGLTGLMLLLARRRQGLKPPGAAALRWVGGLVIMLGLLPLHPAVRTQVKAFFYEVVAFMETHELGELADSSMRLGLFRKTLDMVADSDWLGVGAGNFAVLIRRYDAFFALKPHAHNDALQMLAELGLPGMLLFLGLLAAVALQLLRVLRDERQGPAPICAAGLLGALAAFVVTGVAEVPFRFGASAALFVLVAGLAGRLGYPRAPRPHRSLGRSKLAGLMVVLGLLGLLFVARRLPASFFMARAEAAAARGELRSARSSYELVARLGSGYALPHMELAELALDDGRGEDALAHLQRAEALWPESVELWRALARTELRLERPERAVEQLQRASAASPSDLTVLFELVRALGLAGRAQEAIDLLEFRVHVQRQGSTNTLAELVRLYRADAEAKEGDEAVPGWIGMRHFLAVILEYGPPDMAEWAAGEFKHATHQLQLLPGSPDSWWPRYEAFLADGGWDLPATALYTALDADGVKLYPGWAESAGPPLPLERR